MQMLLPGAIKSLLKKWDVAYLAGGLTTLTTRLSSSGKMKVTMFGGSGDLCPPLALLLHQSPQLDELALVDTECSALVNELNALDNSALVRHHHPEREAPALKDADIVILADAAVRLPDEVRRARIVKHAQQAARVASLVGEHCPQVQFKI